MAGIPLKGSERTPLPGSRATGPADPAERLQVSAIGSAGCVGGIATAVEMVAGGPGSGES